jgi:hypothetical protein
MVFAAVSRDALYLRSSPLTDAISPHLGLSIIDILISLFLSFFKPIF